MKPQRILRLFHSGRGGRKFFSLDALWIIFVRVGIILILPGLIIVWLTSFQPVGGEAEKEAKGEVNLLMELGRQAYEAGEYRAAYGQFRQATSIYQQKNEGPGLIESLAGQANALMTLSLMGSDTGDSVDVLIDSLDVLVERFRLQGDHSMSMVYAIRCVYHLTSGSANSLELGCPYCEQAYQWADSLRGGNYTLLPEYLGNIAYCNQVQGLFEAAYENYREQRRLIRTYHPENRATLAYSYANTAPIFHFWGQLDSARWYSQTAIEILEKHLPEHPDLLTYYINYAALLGETGKLKASRDYLFKAQNILVDQQGETGPSVALSHILNNLAVYYQDMGRSDSAVWYIEKTLEMERQLYGPDHPEIALTLANTGSILAQKGSPDLGLLYLYQALVYLKDGEQDSEADLRNIYREMGVAYSLNGNHDSSFHYFELEIALLEGSTRLNKVDLGKAYANLGQAFYTQKEYLKAALFLEKALNLQRKSLQNEFHPQLAITLTHLGLTYGRLAKWAIGERHLKRSLEIRKHNEDHQISLAYRALGEFYSYTQKYGLARKYYEKALVHISDISQTEAVILLTEAAEVFYHEERSRSADKIQPLRAAKSLYMKAANLTDSLFVGLSSDSSRQLLLENVFPLYESLIDIELQLGQQTDSLLYIESAFALSEKTKASSLLQAFRNRELQHWRDVPDSLIEQGREMRVRMGWLQAFLSFEEGSTAKNAHTELLNLRQEYEKYLNDLRLAHPDYFQLRFAPGDPDIFQIRQRLKTEDLSLLAFFWGEHSIHAFVLKADTIIHKSIEADSQLVHQIDAFAQMCNYPQAHPEDFLSLGHVLYQRLMANLMPYVKDYERLLIIPDGPLLQLPFELLITHTASNPVWYELPYLFRQKQIHYAPSAQLWLQMSRQSQKVQHNGKLIAFAPTFDYSLQRRQESRSNIDLQPLRWNVQEVDQIPNAIPKKVLTAASASESAFKNEAGDYMIIHLATHGILNHQQPLRSFLAFSLPNHPDEDEDQLLHMYELPAQQLHAQLLVLSACETGIGKWERGEGILSMGRAFAYAGASSLLVSLWQVDDASTADFMALFYENLLTGQGKSEALQQAKIQFLDRFPLKTAPYYWAGFVLSGDEKAMQFDRSYSGWWVFAGCLLGVFLFWGIRRYFWNEH